MNTSTPAIPCCCDVMKMKTQVGEMTYSALKLRELQDGALIRSFGAISQDRRFCEEIRTFLFPQTGKAWSVCNFNNVCAMAAYFVLVFPVVYSLPVSSAVAPSFLEPRLNATRPLHPVCMPALLAPLPPGLLIVNKPFSDCLRSLC